jgi:hypothetical protein
MLASRVFHTADLLPNGEVLLAGGTTTFFANGTDIADLFQPATAPFTPTAPGGTTNLLLAAVVLQDGKTLLTGGEFSASPCGEGGNWFSSASATLFDSSDASFSATGNMSTSRLTHTATLLTSGQVLIAGGAEVKTTCNRGFGKSTFPSLASAELFEPTTGTFAPTGNMSTARAGHTATLLANGKVLVVGGVDAMGNTLSTAELFQ